MFGRVSSIRETGFSDQIARGDELVTVQILEVGIVLGADQIEGLALGLGTRVQIIDDRDPEFPHDEFAELREADAEAQANGDG